MAVRLHAQHGFTHACATDGGKGDGPPRGGGALPPGSTVQDAEMQAMLACLRWAADPRSSDVAVGERRLYILSDSNTQLGQVEKALRGMGPRMLRGAHRRGALEEATRLRLTMAKVITQFVRSHEGVRPNAHADMVAAAFMRADEADVHARRQAGLLEFRLVLNPDSGDGVAVPADRAVRGLVLHRMQRHVVRRLDAHGGNAGADAPVARSHAPGMLDWATLRGEPSGLWTALLRRTSTSGSADGGSGHASSGSAAA